MAGAQHEDFRRISSPLDGELIRLRAVEEEDLRTMNREFWNPEVTRFLTVVWPEPISGTRDWLDRVRAGDSDVIFAVETTAGEFVGTVGLHQIQTRARTAILGIWVAQSHWDKGYGTDAVRTACRFAFREMNLQRVELLVYDNNPRGRRAYEKVGFKEEGRLRRAQFVDGRHVDAIVMGLLAEDLIEA